MFDTLENNWDGSGHRAWTTLASFSVQVLGLSVLLLIPSLLIQAPPLLRWFDPQILTPPPAPAPMPSGRRAVHSSNISENHLQQPASIPAAIANLNESVVESAPDLDGIGVQHRTGTSRTGVFGALDISATVAPAPRPTSVHPLKISQWAEGNLINRVQPAYPPIARQAGIYGTVELRAIIGKDGTIGNLVVVSGHPMLVKPAMEAVRQWRYRPYLLNHEPIRVETEITVNFVLSSG